MLNHYNVHLKQIYKIVHLLYLNKKQINKIKKKVKRHPTEWRNSFKTYLIRDVYLDHINNPYNSIIKKTSNPVKKMDKRSQ